MLYMLDSNIVSYRLRGDREKLLLNFEAHSEDDFCVSTIVLSELLYGAAHSSRPERNRVALSLFLSGVDILPYDAEAAMKYATLRDELSRRGELIGAKDMLIAAHSLALGAVLVTHDVGEFERVPGLRVEDWARSD